MKNLGELSYKFSMTFDNHKLLAELGKNIDPYALGVLCGVITGRDLFLPSNVVNLVSLIKALIKDYSVNLEDDDWYLFTSGLLKSLEIYGFDRDYVVEWVTMEEDEVLPEESRILLISKTKTGKKHLSITLFEKE